MKIIIISLVLSTYLIKVKSNFLDGLNVGLTIPAMQIKVPTPAFPDIKLSAKVKMPPKQSLKSMLPKFKYNIPTFNDDFYPMHSMSYSASNQQSVNIKPPMYNQKQNHRQQKNLRPNYHELYSQKKNFNHFMIEPTNNYQSRIRYQSNFKPIYTNFNRKSFGNLNY